MKNAHTILSLIAAGSAGIGYSIFLVINTTPIEDVAGVVAYLASGGIASLVLSIVLAVRSISDR